MNLDILTVAFSEAEISLLKVLQRANLPGDIHAIVTSGLDAKDKTSLLLQQTVDFHTKMDLLTWQPTDTLRAYRQLNTAGVLALRSIIVGTDTNQLPMYLRRAYEALAPSILKGLQQALDTGQEQRVIPIADIRNPKARA